VGGSVTTITRNCSPGINGGELRGQPANQGSPGKLPLKRSYVCVRVCVEACPLGRGVADSTSDNTPISICVICLRAKQCTAAPTYMTT